MTPEYPAAGHKKDLTTRIAVGLIAVFGLLSLILGGWLLKTSLFSPFELDLPELAGARTDITTESQLQADLKNKDTDNDGLNDYEEVYIYATSPYLSDSDSDSASDSAEISRGSDPNCRPNEDCSGIRLLTPETTISDLFPQFTPTDETIRDKTLAQFRELLIQSGMSEEVVNSFNDDFLIVVMQAVVQTDAEQVDINQMTDREIRDFLISLGLAANEVDRIAPADLRELIKSLI